MSREFYRRLEELIMTSDWVQSRHHKDVETQRGALNKCSFS